MNKKIILILCATTVVIGINFVKAQICGSSGMRLDNLVDKADLIVSGKVVDKYSFWNDVQNNIYTRYSIEVQQSSKLSNRQVYVIIEGGTVDDVNMKVYGFPNLTVESEGVFFLNQIDETLLTNTNYTYYKLVDKGVYDVATNTIQNNSSTITVENFNDLINKKYKTFFLFNKKQHKKQQATITNISPKVVAADNVDLLTIIGNGFGNLTGSAKISMRSAASLNESLFIDIDRANIKSWTNTKIQFVVQGDEITSNYPGVASGKIRLTDSAGSLTTSVQTVEVSHNRKLFNGKPIRIRTKNQNGEIPFYVDRKLINDGALPAVENALEIWNCATGSNFAYAGIVDNVCRAYDEINVICYDQNVPDFNLAITKVVSRNCDATMVADQIDADITFNPNLIWGFNDDLTSSQFHFESVLLHELGHAFMLAHVVNNADVMYPSLRNGLIKNELTKNDVSGGLDVLTASTSNIKCSNYGPVQLYSNGNCSNCANVTNVKANNLTKNSTYLTWNNIQNSTLYDMRYRFNGSKWFNYNGKNNNLIMFDLPSCTTVECRFSAFCNNNESSENEIIYRFTTLGCQ